MEKQRQAWYKVKCDKCKIVYKTLPKTLFKPLTFFDCSCGGHIYREREVKG